MKECINCKTLLEDDELFCHECGTKQEIEEPEAQVGDTQKPEVKKCIHCGESIEADSLFCPFCGKEQKEEPVQTIVLNVPEIVKDHMSRVLLNPDKWISTVLFPQKYPNSAFQLLTNNECGFVIDVGLEMTRGEEDLIKRIKQSPYLNKFVVGDPSDNDFYAVMKLGDEDDAITKLSGFLHDIYDQPFDAAIKYETDMGKDKPVTTSISKGKKCIHCGEVLEEESTFCPFCGKPQVTEEVKKDEPQTHPAEPEPQQEPEKPEPKPEEKEQTQAEEQKPTVPTQPEQHEQPNEEQPQAEETYEGEEKKKSKTILWFLLAVLIISGAAWYYLLSGSDSDPYPAVEGDYIEEPTDTIPEDFEEESEMTSGALAFLEDFYKGKHLIEQNIPQYVTANVLNKLKRDYEYDCPSDDCLATWVFTAYPAGADLDLEEGPIFSSTDIDGRYKVDFKYSFYNGEQKGYETRTVYLTVTEMDGKYLISDYEVVDNRGREDENGISSKEIESNVPDESTQTKVINTQDKQGYVAWFVFGTTKELKELDIIDENQVLYEDFSKYSFTKIDIRIDKEIKLYSKSARVLTSHPASAYTLKPNEMKQYVLRITDPQLFWSTSRYLVILAE